MKKILFLITLNCAVTTIVTAQFNTRLQAQIGSCISPNKIDGFHFSYYIVNNLGIGIEQRVFKNISFKLSYEKWQTFAKTPSDFNANSVSIVHPPLSESSIGTLTHRMSFHMLDLAAVYRFSVKRNELYVYAGPSFTFGWNRRLVSYYKPADPMYPDTEMNFDYVMKAYLGGVCELGYNRISKNGRINYGPSVGARFYPNQFTEYNFKLNFGYNFNL